MWNCKFFFFFNFLIVNILTRWWCLISPRGAIDCSSCSQNHGHALFYHWVFYHFGIFCHKATNKRSTEESSHKESLYNTLTVEFSLLSHGQSIIKNFSSTSLASQCPCRCHFSHLFMEVGPSGPVIPHPPNKASPCSVGTPLQFMHPFSELGPWTFNIDLYP